MKHPNPLQLLLTAAIMTLTIACEKPNDIHAQKRGLAAPVKMYCPPKPACQVIMLGDSGDVNRPVFNITPDSLGRASKLDARISVGNYWPYHFDIAYGDSALIITYRDNPLDTFLEVKLDKCGKPVSPHFEYDQHGRLAKYTNWEAHTISYDSLGNVLSIISDNPDGHQIYFEYDYDKPIEKGKIYTQITGTAFHELNVLEYLGHLDLMPTHARTRVQSWMGYYWAINDYSDYEIMEGRVTAYTQNGVRIHASWLCH